MTNETELPWDTLRATTGELPWPALNQFADGLLENPALIHDLGELYDEARAVCAETPTFADLYVAAILALAAPRLNEERRHELAPFIVQKLIDAGQADDDRHRGHRGQDPGHTGEHESGRVGHQPDH